MAKGLMTLLTVESEALVLGLCRFISKSEIIVMFTKNISIHNGKHDSIGIQKDTNLGGRSQ